MRVPSRIEDDTSGRTIAENLRHWSDEYHYPHGLMDKAAERIEQLEAFIDHCRKSHALPAHCCPDVGGSIGTNAKSK